MIRIKKQFFNHDAQAGGFYAKTHAGIDISEFVQNQNFIIEGIRGTGKTHVLKMVEKYCLDNFDSIRILPIFVSLAQISEHARKDPDEFRLHLYTHVVQKCIETVEKYSNYLQQDTTLLEKAIDAVAHLFGIKRRSTFLKTVEEIKKIAEQLRFKLQFDLTSENFKTKNLENYTISANIGGKLGVEDGGIAATAKSGFSKAKTLSQQSDQEIIYIGSKLAHHDAANFILEFLKQIQIILNLEYSLVLLDECSEAQQKAQVEVFRLFKTIRGANSLLDGKDSCAFFIGSVYPRGETYYPSRKDDGFSFEPGQDCSVEFVQWDETDLDTYLSFFKDMTLKRAQQVLNWDGDFDNLCKEIFDSEEAFYLAAYCANGIPRRFWEVLKRAHGASSNIIRLKGIEVAIQEIANNQILAPGYISNIDIAFINDLIDRVSDKNRDIRARNHRTVDIRQQLPQTIYFTVDKRFSDPLRRLVMQGAIHDKSRMRNKLQQSIQQMYSLDLSIVYSYDVIPRKTLTSVIPHDIPNDVSRGFSQALKIRLSTISNLYGSSGESITALESSNGNIVKWFAPKKYGFIRERNQNENIYFNLNDVNQNYQGDIDVNDEVRFFIQDTEKGPRAVNVELLTKAISTGTIKTFDQEGIGFIEVDDGGPEALFFSAQVSSKYRGILKSGDRVKFRICFTNQGGRTAEKVSKVEISD